VVPPTAKAVQVAEFSSVPPSRIEVPNIAHLQLLDCVYQIVKLPSKGFEFNTGKSDCLESMFIPAWQPVV
jgi:hypothetical protein